MICRGSPRSRPRWPRSSWPYFRFRPVIGCCWEMPALRPSPPGPCTSWSPRLPTGRSRSTAAPTASWGGSRTTTSFLIDSMRSGACATKLSCPVGASSASWEMYVSPGARTTGVTPSSRCTRRSRNVAGVWDSTTWRRSSGTRSRTPRTRSIGDPAASWASPMSPTPSSRTTLSSSSCSVREAATASRTCPPESSASCRRSASNGSSVRSGPTYLGHLLGITRRPFRSSWPAGSSACSASSATRCSTRSRGPLPPRWPRRRSAETASASRSIPCTSRWQRNA